MRQATDSAGSPQAGDGSADSPQAGIRLRTKVELHRATAADLAAAYGAVMARYEARVRIQKRPTLRLTWVHVCPPRYSAERAEQFSARARDVAACRLSPGACLQEAAL